MRTVISYTLEQYKEELPHFTTARVLIGEDKHILNWLNAHVGQGCYASHRPDVMVVPPRDCLWYMDWSVGEEDKFDLLMLFRQSQDALLFKLTWGGQ